MTTPSFNRIPRLGWVIGFVAVAVAVSFLFVTVKNPPSRGKGKPSQLERLGRIPEFVLGDGQAGIRSPEDFASRLSVVHFVSTVDSSTLGPMAELERRLVEARARDFLLVTILLDPGIPVPSAQSGNWRFVVCPDAWKRDLLEGGFLEPLLAGRAVGDSDLRHFVVVDREGWIRSFPDGSRPSVAERLLKDLADLYRESPP